MVDALIRWSLNSRPAVLVIALLVSVWGVYAAVKTPVDVFPDLTAPTVTVLTEARGMAPTEVESQVTFPIETALNGAPGVRRVRSSTTVGFSVVWCEFEWGSDVLTARQIVNERLEFVAESLPREVGRPVLAPVSSIMGEVLFIALTSETRDGLELRSLADNLVRRRLLAVPGVAQVTPIGGEVKEYQVHLDPERLRAFGLTLKDVSSALEASNQNISAGFSVDGGSELLVHGLGRIRSLEDIRDTAVASVEDVPVLISDLGRVAIGAMPKRGEGAANGRPAVVLGIQKQPATNTLALTATLDQALDEIERSLPDDVGLDRHVFRQSAFIEVAIDNVAEALRDGALLVVLIVLLFLGNLRATFITLTAIPLSLVVSVLVLAAMGTTINTMTLGGVAIAIGALVDDAVIDVENVFRRLRENVALPSAERRPTLRVVFDASVEIRTSIVFATYIIVLVFLPIFFLGGVEGRLLRPLGLAYVVAILTSLVVAVTVTPVLCSLLLPKSSLRGTAEPWLTRRLKQTYGRLLRPILGRPLVVTLPALALLAAATWSTSRMGLAFLPEFNEGALTIGAVSIPGTSLEESNKLGRVLDEMVLEHPEVVSVARRTGRAELDEHVQGVESSELEVSLAMKERSMQEFLAALRADLALLPGMHVTIGQPISHRIDHMLSGTRASIAVKIHGSDLDQLRAIAHEVEAVMKTVPGIVDLRVDPLTDIPVLLVDIDRDSAARHGVIIEDLAHTLEAAFQGHPATRILEGQRSYELVLRFSEPLGASAWDLASLGDLPVDTASGLKVPLRALADVRRDVGPNRISREDVERKLVVSANVSGHDIGSVVGDCQDLIDPILARLPGYRVEYGGQFESAVEARNVLTSLGVAVILGIGFLLNLAFRSARDAIVVMVNLPLALIGGVVGVFLSGGVLSVASLIGFITVFGIATRNGIMLVSHIRHLQREEGVTSFHEAVQRGAMERLVPIMMTALATMLALIPLALGGGEPGNEIQTPMAIVILFGLTSSMVLNMFVVPVLMLRFGKPEPSYMRGAV
jgi:CzcA family heavy metal efflux pump